MTREDQIAQEIAFDIFNLPNLEARSAYWNAVSGAYIGGLEREGHSLSAIRENYDAFSITIARHLSKLTRHDGGNA